MKNIEEKLDKLIILMEGMSRKIDGSKVAQTVPSVTLDATVTHGKTITLPELARRNASQNGQQRLMTIVGYFEKIKGEEQISIADIQQGWREGKFTGDYAAVYLHRAIKDGYVREREKGSYDLTQTGEDFFASFITPNK